MKKIFIAPFFRCLIATLLLQPVFSQSNHTVTPDYIKANAPVTEEITIKENTTPAANANSKALLSFEKTFKGARDVYWTTNGNKEIAFFKMGDRSALALFTRKGNIIHTIYYGTEKHLPAVEKTLIKTAYEDYDIINVEQVSISGETVWIVLLQNCNKIAKVQIIDGELYELNTYTRSK